MDPIVGCSWVPKKDLNMGGIGEDWMSMSFVSPTWSYLRSCFRFQIGFKTYFKYGQIMFGHSFQHHSWLFSGSGESGGSGGCWELDLHPHNPHIDPQAPRSAPLALQVVLPQCFEAAVSSPSFAGEERGTEGQTCSKSMAFQRCSENI